MTGYLSSLFLVPTVSHHASHLVATYDDDYTYFLHSGIESSNTFLTINEFGNYNLWDVKQLTHFAALMIVVSKQLKKIGPV